MESLGNINWFVANEIKSPRILLQAWIFRESNYLVCNFHTCIIAIWIFNFLRWKYLTDVTCLEKYNFFFPFLIKYSRCTGSWKFFFFSKEKWSNVFCMLAGKFQNCFNGCFFPPFTRIFPTGNLVFQFWNEIRGPLCGKQIFAYFLHVETLFFVLFSLHYSFEF